MRQRQPGEMTTAEAAAYLSEHADYPVSTKYIYLLRSAGRGPIVEKRGSRLVFRREALDAFLAENGTDPERWIGPWAKQVVEQLRSVLGYRDEQLESFVEALDPMKDDLDPDDAR